MSKYDGHTPGPWSVDRGDRVTIRGPRQFPGEDFGHPGTEIASINVGAGMFNRRFESEPNATLIADAPLLLQQLDELAAMLRGTLDILDNCEERGWMNTGPMAGRIRAALAKVEK